MADIENDETKVSRRDVFGLGPAALAAATLTMVGERAANAQRPASHAAPNEINPGQVNGPLAAENPDSEWSPSTDSGTVKPFKYSFSLSQACRERRVDTPGHGANCRFDNHGRRGNAAHGGWCP
jgi:hypothetical protein